MVLSYLLNSKYLVPLTSVLLSLSVPNLSCSHITASQQLSAITASGELDEVVNQGFMELGSGARFTLVDAGKVLPRRFRMRSSYNNCYIEMAKLASSGDFQNSIPEQTIANYRDLTMDISNLLPMDADRPDLLKDPEQVLKDILTDDVRSIDQIYDKSDPRFDFWSISIAKRLKEILDFASDRDGYSDDDKVAYRTAAYLSLIHLGLKYRDSEFILNAIGLVGLLDNGKLSIKKPS